MFFRKNRLSEPLEVPFHPNKQALQITVCLLTASNSFYYMVTIRQGHKQVSVLHISAYPKGSAVLLKAYS